MSAEADQLDREAQRLDDDARQLDEAAAFLRARGNDMADYAVQLQRPFREAVGNTWAGPQADRFLQHQEARVSRMRANQRTFDSVAHRMEDAARKARDEANSKRARAAQLRREEQARAAAQGRGKK